MSKALSILAGLIFGLIGGAVAGQVMLELNSSRVQRTIAGAFLGGLCAVLGSSLAGDWCGAAIGDPYQPEPACREGQPPSFWERFGFLIADPATWRDLVWITVDTLVGWPLTQKVSSLRFLRYKGDAAARAAADADFGTWHLYSLALSLLTVVLVTVLMALAEDKRFRIVGMNYKDEPENARRFLGELGNPFSAVGADRNGRTAIDWGVYGVPESFVVGRDGKIAYKHVGPIDPDKVQRLLMPEIEKALAAGS